VINPARYPALGWRRPRRGQDRAGRDGADHRCWRGSRPFLCQLDHRGHRRDRAGDLRDLFMVGGPLAQGL